MPPDSSLPPGHPSARSSAGAAGRNSGVRIEASQLQMWFAAAPRPVLDQIDFQVDPGEFVTVLGPSGCGKSTLLRLVAGLLEPSSGSIRVGGGPPRAWADLAYVFQEPGLLPWRTVGGNIRLPLELAGRPPAEQKEAVRSSLPRIGLSAEDETKYPRMLSGGMRMRVALARALVTDPSVLLLDEPFAALDDLLREQLNEELLMLWQRQKCTALFVTHNIAEAVFLSQRLLILAAHPGRLVATIDVPFPYPRAARLRSDPHYHQLCDEVAQRLRGGALP